MRALSGDIMNYFGRVVFFVLSVSLVASYQFTRCSVIGGVKEFFYYLLEDEDEIDLASPEVQELVASIKAELGMKDIAVEVFTDDDESSVASTFPTFGEHLIYINKDRFMFYTRHEQRAIIGHELIHIRNNHLLKEYLAQIVIYSSLVMIMDKLVQQQKGWKDLSRLSIAVGTLGLVGANCTLKLVGRYFEKEADIISAQELKTARGLISFFRKIDFEEKKYLNPERYRKAGFLARCERLFLLLFATHPSCAERIAYLQKLMQSKEYQKSL